MRKMISCLLIFLFLLVVPALAQDVVMPGTKLADEMPQWWKSGTVVHTADGWIRGLPSFAWVNGSLATQDCSLTYSRMFWTLQGQSRNDLVDLRWDHDKGTIRGEANGLGYDVKVAWKPERARITGRANGHKCDYLVDWKLGTVQGTCNDLPVNLTFSEDQGFVKGIANGQATSLTYDKTNGDLTGQMQCEVKLRLVNLGLYDFFIYLPVYLAL